MKNSQFASLARKIDMVGLLPGFIVKGALVYAVPVGDILRGICFSRSGDKNGFYVHYFFQPMFIPVEYVILSFGQRLRTQSGSEWWSIDDIRLEEEFRHAILMVAKPFLSEIDDLEGVVGLLRKITPNLVNTREYRAATLARLGRLLEARDEWTELLALLDHKNRWEADVAQRVSVLQGAFARSMAEGQAQLDAWAAETRTNLKLSA